MVTGRDAGGRWCCADSNRGWVEDSDAGVEELSGASEADLMAGMFAVFEPLYELPLCLLSNSSSLHLIFKPAHL